MVEYAITLALIAMSVIAAAIILGHSMTGNFGGLEKEMRASQAFQSYFESESKAAKAKAKRKRPATEE